MRSRQSNCCRKCCWERIEQLSYPIASKYESGCKMKAPKPRPAQQQSLSTRPQPRRKPTSRHPSAQPQRPTRRHPSAPHQTPSTTMKMMTTSQPTSQTTKTRTKQTPIKHDEANESQHAVRDVRDQLQKIMNLTAHETATVPDVAINVNRKLSRGWSQANEQLQLDEWAHMMYFAGTIINDSTRKNA